MTKRILCLFVTATCLIIIFTPYTHSQEWHKEPGWRNERIKDWIELREKLQEIERKNKFRAERYKEYLDGYIIKGCDIVKVIKKSDIEIRIVNSVIVNGLDFHNLPTNKDGKREINNVFKVMSSEIYELKRVDKSIIASSVIFTKDISFEGDVINQDADFFETNFMGNASFIGTIFKAFSNFNSTEFYGSVNFEDAKFETEIFFNEAKFNGASTFYNAKFNGDAYFVETNFIQPIDFVLSNFREKAKFYKAIFNEAAYFNGAIFDGAVDFKRVTFRGEAVLDKVTFAGDADFVGVTFTKYAGFFNSTFTRNVDFTGVTFGGDSVFIESLFNENVDYTETKFNGNARFWNIVSYGTFKFMYSVFNGNIDFRDALIRKFLFINDSLTEEIDATFDFRYATISESHFEELQFTRRVDFSDVYFGELVQKSDSTIVGRETDFRPLTPHRFFAFLLDEIYTSINTILEDQEDTEEVTPVTLFRSVTFQSNADFTRDVFYGDVLFESVNFEKKANFTNVEFKQDNNGVDPRLSFSYVTFQDFIFNFDNFPKPENWINEGIDSFYDRERKEQEMPIARKPPQKLSQVFEQLYNIFNRQNNLSAKNKAYYYMKVAELEEATRNITIIEKLKTSEYRYYLLWGWSSGWGTKIWRIIGWYVGGLIFFAMFYYVMIDKVRIWKGSYDVPLPDSEFRMRLFAFPWNFFSSDKTGNKEVKDFISALKLSKILILKIGRRDSYVEGRTLKIAVWVEWFFGYYLLAVFVLTLKNTVPIINSLVSQVF